MTDGRVYTLEDEIRVGRQVPWYRVNGWIPQSGGPEWTRYQLYALGFLVAKTPWIFTGDVWSGSTPSPPTAVTRRTPF